MANPKGSGVRRAGERAAMQTYSPSTFWPRATIWRRAARRWIGAL